FERPYVLVPDKKGEKGYVLLREAIREAGKAGIAKVVIRARQYLGAVIPQGDALVLELLRYDQELIDLKDYDLPTSNLRMYGVAREEIDLASKLSDGRPRRGKASKFHDEYREALMKLVQKKVASGQTEAIDNVEEDESPVRQTINFMDVLKKSVAHASKGRTKAPTKAKSTAAGRGRRPRKKRAG